MTRHSLFPTAALSITAIGLGCALTSVLYYGNLPSPRQPIELAPTFNPGTWTCENASEESKLAAAPTTLDGTATVIINGVLVEVHTHPGDQVQLHGQMVHDDATGDWLMTIEDTDGPVVTCHPVK